MSNGPPVAKPHQKSEGTGTQGGSAERSPPEYGVGEAGEGEGGESKDRIQGTISFKFS